jgi:tetratricopeptide (TPR) repeat protein
MAYAQLPEPDYKNAIADFNTAIEARLPARFLAFAYLNLGTTHARQGELDRASQSFDRSIKLGIAPFAVQALYYRAGIFEQKNDHDHAISDYSTAIELRPDAPTLASAYLNLGNIFARKGEFDRAIDNFNKAIELGIPPFNTESLHSRASVFEQKNDYNHAIADYGEILKVAPETLDAYAWRARAYRAVDNFPAALADHTAQITHNARDSRAHDNRGDTYYFGSF